MKILVLGPAGSGKTTFINSIDLYQNNSSLDDIKKRVDVQLRLKFNYEGKVISREGKRDNDGSKNDDRVNISYESDNYEFIDTPGLDGPEDYENDKKNIQLIIEKVKREPDIDTVCLVLKPDETRANVLFTYFFNNLIVPVLNILENCFVIFCFTYAKTTFYQTGGTLPTLQTVFKRVQHSALSLDKNLFCFDNEGIRYLILKEEKVGLRKEEKRSAKQSWDHSKKELVNMLLYLKKHKCEKKTTRQNSNIQTPYSLNKETKKGNGNIPPGTDNNDTELKSEETHVISSVDDVSRNHHVEDDSDVDTRETKESSAKETPVILKIDDVTIPAMINGFSVKETEVTNMNVSSSNGEDQKFNSSSPDESSSESDPEQVEIRTEKDSLIDKNYEREPLVKPDEDKSEEFYKDEDNLEKGTENLQELNSVELKYHHEDMYKNTEKLQKLNSIELKDHHEDRYTKQDKHFEIEKKNTHNAILFQSSVQMKETNVNKQERRISNENNDKRNMKQTNYNSSPTTKYPSDRMQSNESKKKENDNQSITVEVQPYQSKNEKLEVENSKVKEKVDALEQKNKENVNTAEQIKKRYNAVILRGNSKELVMNEKNVKHEQEMGPNNNMKSEGVGKVNECSRTESDFEKLHSSENTKTTWAKGRVDTPVETPRKLLKRYESQN